MRSMVEGQARSLPMQRAAVRLLDDTRFWSGIERDFPGFRGALRAENG
jgi:hypothetical protein